MSSRPGIFHRGLVCLRIVSHRGASHFRRYFPILACARHQNRQDQQPLGRLSALVRVIAPIWPLLNSRIWVFLGFLARLVGAAATPTSDTQAVINVDSIAFILIFVGDQSAVSDLACLMNWSFKSRLFLQSTHFFFLASQINALGSHCDFN